MNTTTEASRDRVAAIAARQNPAVKFKEQFEARRLDFVGALPTHISYERFARVVQTAVSQNPSLLFADRASLFTSCLKSAIDGLLCDGREAALVIYRSKDGKDEQGRDRWIDKIQYMPMVAGILKKCRNSGELSSIVAKVVYGGDRFRNWIDNSGEHLEYESSDDQDRNLVRCAFAMAKLKDGAVEIEVLKPADIERIRSVSRAKDKGPWVEWWEEMAKKSAIRRLAKRLPLSTDLDDLIRRNDSLYDFEGAPDKTVVGPRPKSLGDRLDALVGPEEPHDPETGEIIDHSDPSPGARDWGSGKKSSETPAEGSASAAGRAEQAGRPASSSRERNAPPPPDDSPSDDTGTIDRSLLLQYLMLTGERIAREEGSRALKLWLDVDLNGDELAVLTAGHVRKLEQIAADGGRERAK